MQKRTPLVFRQTESNFFSIPVLFHALEKENLDKYFHLQSVTSIKSIVNTIRKNKTTIVAYSFMTSSLPEVFDEIKYIRKETGNTAYLVAGGPHPTGDPDCTLKLGFDTVFRGEGEQTLPEFCRRFLDNGKFPIERIFKSEKPVDLNHSLPISKNYNLIPPLEITRGCSHRCTFCQTGGSHPVHRSPQSVQVYLDEMISRNYTNRVGFICPSGVEYSSNKPGIRNLRRLESILSMAREKNIRHIEYGIFPSEVRPDTVNRTFLNIVKKYCTNRKITIGAQSGSDRILKIIRRNHTTEDIRQAAALIREAGFTPVLDFIIGFPDETEDDRNQTLRLIKKLNDNYQARIQVHYFLPLAGTAMAFRSPLSLDNATIQTLNQYYLNGFCTDWWKTGMKIADKIASIRIQVDLQPPHRNFSHQGF